VALHAGRWRPAQQRRLGRLERAGADGLRANWASDTVTVNLTGLNTTSLVENGRVRAVVQQELSPAGGRGSMSRPERV
jgi:hypothetical protein